jgi:hypothetical protein
MALTTREATRKTYLENAVAAIQDAQMGMISGGVQEMSISGRSLIRFKPHELEDLYKKYSAELARLEGLAEGTRTRTVRVVG